MAIKLCITEDNGIVTEYHRIALLSIDVNNQNTILVHSYLSADGRQIEKDYSAGLYKDVEAGLMKFPYVAAEYISAEYNPDMTVSAAYTYLKSLPKFAGAVDV
jgi:hypothetical protein